MTSIATDCSCDSRWKIDHKHSENICVLCSLNQLNDRNQPNYNKKYILTHIYSRLKYGSETSLSRLILNADHLNTIFAFIFDSNRDISEMAANVVLVLMSQSRDEVLNQSIFTQTISIIVSLQQIGCTSLAFISRAIAITNNSIVHILDKDCEFVQFLSINYRKSQEIALKLAIMQIFAQIYKSSQLNDLFWLEHHFHQNTIEMCFKAFNTGAEDLILITLVLLNNVKYNREIVSIILNTSELYKCLNTLISGNDNDIVIALSQWICKLLEASDDHTFANNICINQIVDKIFDALSSSGDTNRSQTLLLTIDLIVNRSTHFATTHHPTYIVDGFNKALKLSLDKNNDNLCRVAMRTFSYLLQSYKQTNLMNQFHYFNTFKLIEKVLPKYALYSDAVNLATQLFQLYRIPIHFPADTLFNFLRKVVACNEEIDSFVVNSEPKLNSENVDRFNAAINLMNTTLAVIKEFYKNKNDCQRLALESFDSLENSQNPEIIDETNNIDTNDINELDSFIDKFESIIEFCLRNVEKVFDHTIKLFVHYNRNSIAITAQHITLISNLRAFLLVIFSEQLNITHHLISFSDRILMNGIISFLWQLINFHYIYWSTYLEIKDFRKNIATVLTVFILFMESKNELPVISINCEEMMAGFEAINVSMNSIHEIISDWIEYENTNNYSQFCFSLFAISYYCLIFDKNYEIEKKLLNIICEAIQTIVFEKWNNCSLITVKHILFLIAALDCDEQMSEQIRINYIPNLFQYLRDKSDHCLTQIYTNEIRMLNWAFNSAPNRSFFGHFALRTFMTTAPLYQYEAIFQFINFMAQSDDAILTLMDVIFESYECFNLVSQVCISNGDAFIDSAVTFENWQQFRLKVFVNLYDAVCKIANSSKYNDNNLYGTEFSNLIELLCKFRAQMFSRTSLDGKYDLSQNDDSLDILNQNLCHFMDDESSESVASAIFWHLRQCFHSFSEYNSIRLTETILQSITPVFVAFKYATKDLGATNWRNRENTKLKERSVYLLATLTKYKSEDYRLNYSISLDSNTIIDWLLHDSLDINQSAILLLSKCFDGNIFFSTGYGYSYRSSIETSLKSNKQVTKIVRINPEIQMRKLMLSLVNSISKSSERLANNDTDICLRRILNYLMCNNKDLFKHIENHPWYRILKSY